MRTLRLPETGTHPLPPGLGTFPLRRVADYPDRAPAEWLARGGVMLPVYQREAMWLSFSATAPAALQVGVGRCARCRGGRAAYTAAGLSWFDYYDADVEDLPAAGPPTGVKPVGDWLGDDEQPWAEPQPGQVHKLKDNGGQVTDGDW
jgi:hypothetical protein